MFITLRGQEPVYSLPDFFLVVFFLGFFCAYCLSVATSLSALTTRIKSPQNRPDQDLKVSREVDNHFKADNLERVRCQSLHASLAPPLGSPASKSLAQPLSSLLAFIPAASSAMLIGHSTTGLLESLDSRRPSRFSIHTLQPQEHRGAITERAVPRAAAAPGQVLVWAAAVIPPLRVVTEALMPLCTACTACTQHHRSLCTYKHTCKHGAKKPAKRRICT